MKYFLILSMIVCNACYGQTTQDTINLFDNNGWKKGAVYFTPNPGDGVIYSSVVITEVDSVYKKEQPVYHRKQDTVKVICQISDTARQFYIQWRLDLSHAKTDTTKVWGDVSGIYEVPDTIYTDYIKSIYWQELYIVRELHNTSEGVIDPLICQGCNWHDYYQNLYYLDKDKKKLSPNIVVWQSIEVK